MEQMVESRVWSRSRTCSTSLVLGTEALAYFSVQETGPSPGRLSASCFLLPFHQDLLFPAPVSYQHLLRPDSCSCPHCCLLPTFLRLILKAKRNLCLSSISMKWLVCRILLRPCSCCRQDLQVRLNFHHQNTDIEVWFAFGFMAL